MVRSRCMCWQEYGLAFSNCCATVFVRLGLVMYIAYYALFHEMSSGHVFDTIYIMDYPVRSWILITHSICASLYFRAGIEAEPDPQHIHITVPHRVFLQSF